MFSSFLLVLSQISFSQNALNFDGGNDVVQTTFPGVQGAQNRTFEAWVFVDPSAPTSNLCITDYGTNAVGSRNTFNVSGARGLSFISGGTNANIGSSGGVVPVGEWVHVAFVLNNAVGFLYVNGSQVGTGNLSTVNTPSGNQSMRIGQRVNGGSIPFQGSIDEVRIWNVARTQAQIQADTINEFCSPPTGLVAYYKFNQGIAGGNNTGVTTLIDEVSGNNGTLSGFALTGSTSNWVTGKALIPPAPVSSTDTVSACESYTSPSGTQVWTSSGIYNDTVTGGCDTVYTIDLTILNNTSGTLTTTACDSLVSPSGRYVYYSTGTYSDTLPNSIGCDSIITINLTVPVIDDSVSVNANDLTAMQAGANYQWFDCNAGYVPISGANSQTYTITGTGNYAVEIDVSGCLDTSDCILVFLVGLERKDLKEVLVYPNPSSGEIFISDNYQGRVVILDSKGKLVFESNNSSGFISLPKDLYDGIYFLQLGSSDSIQIGKILLRRD